MKLKPKELEFLSTWAREEKSSDPFALPAHKLQALHKVAGVVLIRFIKAWARAEGKKDEDIFSVQGNASPGWPWASETDVLARLAKVADEVHA